MTAHTINLETVLRPGDRTLSGRSKGESLRQRENLGVYDAMADARVRIVVPARVFSVSSSFVLGLCGDSIRALGEKRFRERFAFEGRLPKGVLDYAVRQALRESSAIPG